MKNKGFTLIELLGVIVILSAILLIIVPGVTSNIKKAQNNSDENTKENIILAAQNWASDNKSVLNSKTSYSVALKTLQDEGYLEDDIKLPSTGSKIENACVVISIKQTENKPSYTYTYEDECAG